jgi:hypothetical protein
VAEPLAILLLPAQLEEFELADHARDLLQIPRVIALEPPRWRTRRILRDVVPVRQAKRLRLPGDPRVLVLYHPGQYPLARALRNRYAQSELWYMRPDLGELRDELAYSREELLALDELACERAVEVRLIRRDSDPRGVNEPLRVRLYELEIISARPFVPGARVRVRVR